MKKRQVEDEQKCAMCVICSEQDREAAQLKVRLKENLRRLQRERMFGMAGGAFLYYGLLISGYSSDMGVSVLFFLVFLPVLLFGAYYYKSK